jgi:hypothetical protein
MIAGRRDRKRSLIRSKAMAATMTRSLSTKDGVATFQRGFSSDFSHTTPLSSYTVSAAQPDLTMYLRQLSTLYTAGILTDEEFSAARSRLLGS